MKENLIEQYKNTINNISNGCKNYIIEKILSDNFIVISIKHCTTNDKFITGRVHKKPIIITLYKEYNDLNDIYYEDKYLDTCTIDFLYYDIIKTSFDLPFNGKLKEKILSIKECFAVNEYEKVVNELNSNMNIVKSYFE